jgi:hypothetical protein
MGMKMGMIRFFNQFLIIEIFFCHKPHPRSLSKGEGGRAFVYKCILVLTHHYYLFNHHFYLCSPLQ